MPCRITSRVMGSTSFLVEIELRVSFIASASRDSCAVPIFASLPSTGKDSGRVPNCFYCMHRTPILTFQRQEGRNLDLVWYPFTDRHRSRDSGELACPTHFAEH